MIRIDDSARVRVVTLERPDRLNAFNEALYDATAEALLATAIDPGIAVLVITGTGRAFSAGTDVVEMAARNDGAPVEGTHGFAAARLRRWPWRRRPRAVTPSRC